MKRAARTRALWSTAAAALVVVAPVTWGAAGPPASASSSETPEIVWREPVVVSFHSAMRPAAITANDGVLVALSPIGQDSEWPGRTRVQTSTDGIGWSESAPLDGVALVDVVAEEGDFVAAGTTVVDGTTTPVAATSPNGTDWRVVELDGGAFGGYALDVAVTPLGILIGGGRERGDNASLPAAWLSTDGDSWQAVEPAAFDLGDLIVAPVSGVVLEEVGSAGDTAVVVGQLGDEGGPLEMRSWRSTDGVRWTPVPGLGDVIVFTRGMASGRQGAVLVADSDDATVDYTASITWRIGDDEAWGERGALPGLPDSHEVVVSDVAFGRGGYVAVGDDRTRWDAGSVRRPAIWLSPDGLTWQQVPQAELSGPTTGANAGAEVVVHDEGDWYVFGWLGLDGENAAVLWRGEAAGATTPSPTAPAPASTLEPTTTAPTTEPSTTASPAATDSTLAAMATRDGEQTAERSPWLPVAALAGLAAAAAAAAGLVTHRTGQPAAER